MVRESSYKNIERKIKGHKALERGLFFEDRVLNWLVNEGYVIKGKRRKGRFGEVDIIAEKEERGFLRTTYEVLFVECKHKQKITLKDFQHFVSKFENFLNREPYAYGLFAYRGELDKDIRRYYNQLREELRERIDFKKFK